jgi:ubiquinone/menaquinone biosynthesis C-methylase UbiE
MDRAARFWDRIAERYARRPVPDEAAYQKKLQLTREHFRSDMEVLEFGCGTGSTAIAHAPYVKHIRAVDISEKMIEIARGKAEASNVHNVTFEQAAVEDLDVPDQSLDVVLGLSILHLLEDRADVIRRVYRMLEPGGLFVSSTACLGDSMKWFGFIGPIGHFLGVLPRVKVFTRKELENDLTVAGFEIEHAGQPAWNAALFIIARKPARPADTSVSPGW